MPGVWIFARSCALTRGATPAAGRGQKLDWIFASLEEVDSGTYLARSLVQSLTRCKPWARLLLEPKRGLVPLLP